MNKRIISFILIALTLANCFPVSILAASAASDTDSANTDSELPVVSVSSMYAYDDGTPEEFRALPDNQGSFYLDIELDKAPSSEENIIVYYRTVDDSAVSAWGDYEGVDANDEPYVTLSKSNGYKARVIIKSTVLSDGFVTPGTNGSRNNDKLVSRRFLFELTRVEGNAVLHTPKEEGERDKSELYCYLRANRYHYQLNNAAIDISVWESYAKRSFQEQMRYLRIQNSGNSVIEAFLSQYQKVWDAQTKDVKYESFYMSTNGASSISTPRIQYKGKHTASLNFTFDEEWRNYATSGWCDLGISIIGLIKSKFWDSDGPATFHLYYEYGGQKKRALTLYLEGEFDDSIHFGWEHAFEYAIEGNKANNRKDHMGDNFIGFALYDNDGNVAFEVKMDDSRSSVAQLAVCEKLKDCLIAGHAAEMLNASFDLSLEDGVYTSYYLRLPSNFALADSYSYEFISDSTDEDEIRWLENVNVAFTFIGNKKPMIAKDAKGNQMVTTNVETMKTGDPLRMTVRFDRPVYIADPDDLCHITVDVHNDKGACIAKNLKLSLKQMDGTTASGKYYYYASDTFVFEGELPASMLGTKIASLRNIKINDGTNVNTNPTKGIKSYFTNLDLIGKTIANCYVEKDLRTPVAAASLKSSDQWAKSKPIDIYVHVEGSNSARFNDYVTVYYQWSNSKELPKTYSSKLTIHTADNGTILKTIIGTGNGKMYLHMKAVSSYGASSVSDSLTSVYDPSDENATYTPFGPFLFDNTPPELSVDDITVTGTLKEHTVKVPLPDDHGGIGVRDISLYYIAKDSENAEGTLLKQFTADQFVGESKELTYTISHTDVSIGVGQDGALVLDRGEIEFYWLVSDRLGNTSGKQAEFSLTFDTNDYLDSEITSVGPYDLSTNAGNAQFGSATKTVDEFTFIYDFGQNEGKTVNLYQGSGQKVYYGFSFTIKDKAFGETDRGLYDAIVTYKGERLDDSEYSVPKLANGVYVLMLHSEVASGRYDIQLTRTEDESVQVSRVYSVYATDGEADETAIKNKITEGTLLSNTVYQLSTEYPYFYYKDINGNRQQEYYGATKQSATFSSYSKAKEYVYYKELSDIHLVKLTEATANALSSGTAGYVRAKSEDVTPQAGQYWIRYKSESWTPTSGDSSWVYYYYGMSDVLTEGAFSSNLLNALNAVANRIVGYGRAVVLTDTSLFLGSATGEKMLDGYGMPYLLEGQIHNADEMSAQTMCGNVWSIQVSFAADKSIYKSSIYVGVQGTADYGEYPIVGSFTLPEDSRFQYMTYEQYKAYEKSGNVEPAWKDLRVQSGQGFIDVLTASGVYYIREISFDGVSVYAIYIDKDAPKITFSHTDEKGGLQEIPVDGVEILDIRTKDLYIGSVAATEYDRLSYVAVYKASSLTLESIYTAYDLEQSSIKLEDGNYYLVVADRSGNHYTVTAKVSSSDLSCELKQSQDRFIRLTCNRKSDQIVRYEIYLNGELLTSTYSPEQTFDKAGLYSIYIQDIYGNVFAKEYLFHRNYPTVTWKYFGSDGKYHTYDSMDTGANGFAMTWVSDNQCKISTAVNTRFSFSESYEFEFIGTAPKYQKTVGAETVVTIDAGQSFTLKVYYKSHKDCYTIYSGVMDVTAPIVNVSAEMYLMMNGEYDHFDKWLEGNIGDAIKMDDIYFELFGIEDHAVTNGESISSDIIRINASDANGMSLIQVYLDGTVIHQQDTQSGFSEIIVSRFGDYRVVAKDALGNTSEFTFTNGMPDVLSYFVDGVEKDIELQGYLNFELVDGKHVYNKVDYGNTEMKIDIRDLADVFMSVGVSGDTVEAYGFRVFEGTIYPITYKVFLDYDDTKAIELEMGDPIFSMYEDDFKFGKEYLISKAGAHEVYASSDSNGVVSIKVYAPKDTSKVVTVNARVEFFDSTTMFVSTEISKKSSSVPFKELGTQTGTDIRANNGFTVDESAFEAERIESVRLYYSKLNNLSADDLDGKIDVYTTGETYTDEGFYLMIVRNLYGNEKVYRITVSRTFGVTASVTFADGDCIYYTKDYNGKLYSNHLVSLDLLDDNVKVEVTMNGDPYTGFVREQEDGVTYLIFSNEGVYVARLTDSYGNVITKQFEINKSPYSVGDELLTGYNEKALRRDEGYTNQMLSIDKDVLFKNSVYYLAIRYEDEVTVYIDAFSETIITTDLKDLVNVVGASGDGEYTVLLRNRYGALVTKVIQYRSTPTLKLERTTRSHLEAETYSLGDALSIGFWSNETLSFATDAKTYIFTVNGNATECPRTLYFESEGEFGSFEYEISYIDEYGFEYRFKAYLVRKSVDVELSSDITGTEINGILNTKNDITVLLGENINATYTRNNGEVQVYRAGDVLKMDGTYKFTVIDYAGNAATMTVKKDTAVEFAIVDERNETAIQNGCVVNSSKVEFRSLNQDSAYIEKVLLNGVLQTDFTGSRFQKDGKWELILCDKIGNKAYFCFYIVTRAQNGFAYTTPCEYRITEMWYDSGDGVRVSYMNFVNHGKETSSFDFKENGTYYVVMTWEATGIVSTFEFTVDTTAPDVSLLGCNVGESTINDVSITGCQVGDRILVYKEGRRGQELVEEIEVTSLATKMPNITEGGSYRIVVESEAGVTTELAFVRRHVMNTAGSAFIMVLIGLAVVGLFTGLIYRNKSKTDD